MFMNTLNMPSSELGKYRNEISQKFFNRPEQELNSKEIIFLDKYIDDHNHPQWKQVILNGKRTIYSVSNTGLVMNSKTNYILKANKSRKGYLLVGIENHSCKVHRLVAEAFIPNPENKPQVNHIDGNKSNNDVSNLEWVTQEENMKHAVDTGLLELPKGGIEARHCIYTEKDVHDVCKLLEQEYPGSYIANKLNVSLGFIYEIKQKRSWKYISDQYNLPKIKPITIHSNELINNVFECFNKGITNKKQILKNVGMEKNKTNIRYIKYLRDKWLHHSTTIDQLGFVD